MSCRNKNKSRGFTLIEILIAVGILATAIVTIMSQIEVGSGLSYEDQLMMKVVLLANNKMVELENEINDDMSRGKFPDETSKAGTFDSPDDDFNWQYDIKKVEIPVMQGSSEGQDAATMSVIQNLTKELSKAVRQLTLTVNWTDPEDDKNIQTITLTTHLVNIP